MKLVLIFMLLGVAFATSYEENEADFRDVFEGDMILTPEQKMAALSGGDVDGAFGRASIKNRRWPSGVFIYDIHKDIEADQAAMDILKAAFNEWSSKTCIKFKRRTNERGYAFFRTGIGCASYVGRSGARQTISLGSGCWTMGIIAHEIGHALGFYHEQSRPDRDDYVTIKWENIFDHNKRNFKKYDRSTIDSLGTPYDYGSIMHYGALAFSKNRQPTIVAKQDGVTIGQRKGVSPIDAKQMNLLYKEECNGGGGGNGGGGSGGSSCADKNKNCKRWLTYCNINNYVKQNCKKTCKLC